jgi:hypothetical protein
MVRLTNYYGKILPSEEANRYFDLLMQDILKEKLHGMAILNTCILIQIQQSEH